MISKYKKTTCHPYRFVTGFSMIEVMISVLVGAILLTTFMTLVIQSTKIERTNKDSFRAELYLREMIEAAKDLEQSNWGELISCNNPCHPQISGNAWVLGAGEETMDGIFTRSITIEPAQRDNSGSFPNNIVESGGTNDPNTKKIKGTISWDVGENTRTITLDAYVYHYE